MDTLSKHLILDIWLRKNMEFKQLKNILASCLLKHKQLILSFEEWEFYPQGNSGVFLIATSHASVHTYPEAKYMSIDVYSCDRDFNAENFTKDLLKQIPVKNHTCKTLERGRKP